MKKFSFLYLFLIGWFVACNDDTHDTWTIPPDKTPVSAYAVSEEAALANLDSVLGALYNDESETRTTSAKPRIASIRPVNANDFAGTTRSESTPDTETLLYIVAFEEGAGSAILGADTRVEKVYAILDETVLTPEDFTTRLGADSSDDMQNPVDFITRAIVADAVYRVATDDGSSNGPADAASGGTIIGGDDGGFVRAPTYRHIEINVFRQKPLTKTKWDQGYPYNNDCPITNSKRCPAGCAAIAVAQLLSYHQTGETITIAGTSYSWDSLNEFNYGIATQTNKATDEIARFIHAIGVRLNTHYAPTGSSTSPSSVPGVLNELGLRNAKVIAYDFKTGRNMVCSKKKPFYMRGEPDSSNKGHAWIVDGWNEYTTQCWETTYGPNGKINPERLIEETYYCLVHCNYGWRGKCDGYYFNGIFDATKELPTNMIDSNVGDRIYCEDDPNFIFTRDFKMITYDK